MSWYSIERASTVVAVFALAIWVGGLVALGACAAPMVFQIVPAPLSGDAMGAAFRRFDAIAISASVLVLASEAVRIRFAPGDAVWPDRARTALSVIAAAAAIYAGARLSPSIMALHAAGAVRGLEAAGLELERLHHQAETVAKLEVGLGLFLLALQVTTVRRIPEKRP